MVPLPSTRGAYQPSFTCPEPRTGGGIGEGRGKEEEEKEEERRVGWVWIGGFVHGCLEDRRVLLG